MVELTPSPEGFRKIKRTLSDYSVTRESREKAAAAFLVQDEFEPRLLPKTKSKSLSCSSSLPCSLWAMASLVVFIALHLEGRSLSDETLFQSSTGDMDRHTYPELIYKKKDAPVLHRLDTGVHHRVASLQIPWNLQPCSACSSLLHYLHMALRDILFSPFAMKKSTVFFWTCQSAWNVVLLHFSPFKGSVAALCRNGHFQLSMSYRQMDICHCFP